MKNPEFPPPPMPYGTRVPPEKGERFAAPRPPAALPHAAGEPSADAAGPLRAPEAAPRDTGRSGGDQMEGTGSQRKDEIG